MRIDENKQGWIASALRSVRIGAGVLLFVAVATPGCDEAPDEAAAEEPAQDGEAAESSAEPSVCDEALRHMRDCLGDEDENVLTFGAMECTQWTEAAEMFVQLDCGELADALAVDPEAPPQVKEDGCSRTHWSCGGWPWDCWCVTVPCDSCNCVNWC